MVLLEAVASSVGSRVGALRVVASREVERRVVSTAAEYRVAAGLVASREAERRVVRGPVHI